MARSYRLGFWRRVINRLIRSLLKLGLLLPNLYLLRVRGRKSGRMYSTPVTLVEDDGARWLVAPYGEVSWVKNARASGEVTLSRGQRTETVKLAELAPEEAAPILKRYLVRVPIVRPFFDVTPHSNEQEFVREASRHPVFRIEGAP
jgi:deazaflavin-dependent oxidoreductase (nitroreductase family)